MDEQLKVIVFTLREQRFGVEVKQVLSIEKLLEITNVPRTSNFIKGIVHLRGETIPVIDLKERLDMEPTEKNDQNRILVVQVQDVQVGLIVDSATDVLDIASDSIEAAPSIIGGVQETYLKGVAKSKEELLLLLDLERILDLQETEEVKEVLSTVTK